MKIAIIGGGSAGYMAAAHLSQVLPECELTHIQDSSIPRIGVGEGTTPPFVHWMDRVLGVTFDELRDRCLATPKAGIRFEHWGEQHPHYIHWFSPDHEGPAYHISTDRLVDLLSERIHATDVDANVVTITSSDGRARIELREGRTLTADLVLDARGFPRALDESHEALDYVPTNAAVVQRGPVAAYQGATRAVARPHGWIFVIPLTEYTSYGYVYNANITATDELDADFDRFLSDEGVEADDRRHIPFPNYVHRRMFDGHVFRIGNAASFVEPLEATALALILLQLDLVTIWIRDRMTGLPTGEEEAAALNAGLIDHIRSIGLFVGWHYAEGAPHNTPFWSHARGAFRAALATEDPEMKRVRTGFADFVEQGRAFPASLVGETDLNRIRELEREGPSTEARYGGFFNMSFGKVGHGVGAYGPLVGSEPG